MTLTRPSFLLRLALPTLAVLCTESSAQEPTYPTYQLLRQNEDWSEFEAPLDSSDWADRVKHIELGSDGDVWLSLGVSARARYESWNNFRFGNTVDVSQDDGFLLTRALLHGDLHFHERGRAFVEIISAFSTDRDLVGGERAVDVDEFDFQQAFVDWEFDLGDAAFIVRPGRQSFEFGVSRLVGAAPWRNTLRTWDGISAESEWGNWTSVGFWTYQIAVDNRDLNSTDDGTSFFGVYNTANFDEDLEVDAYLLGVARDVATFNGTTGGEERYTVGTRISERPASGRFDYDAEAAYQFGDIGAGDISAYMVSAVAGYSTDVSGVPLRLHAGYDLASGDGRVGGKVQTFNQLFPRGHRHFGQADIIGRQNNSSYHVGLSLKPTASTNLSVKYLSFALADRSDALYSPGGGVRIGGSNGSRDVADEIDLTLSFQVGRHANVFAGYSRVFTGDVIEAAAGSSDDIDLVFVGMQYTF